MVVVMESALSSHADNVEWSCEKSSVSAASSVWEDILTPCYLGFSGANF